MKSKYWLYLGLTTLFFTILSPITVQAASVSDMKAEEARVKEEGASLNREIDAVVKHINEKYQELAKIEEKITTSKENIEKTEKDIQQTQGSIDKRTELVANRMQNLQVNGSNQGSIQMLLESENFSDFINRAYAVTVLQSAEKTKVMSLYQDKEHLNQLETQLKASQDTLEKEQQQAETEQSELDQQVKGLQAKLAKNETTLRQVTEQRIAKEAQARAEQLKRQQAEKERQAKEKAAEEEKAAEQVQQVPTHPEEKPQKPDVEVPTQPTPPTEVTPPSGMINGQATAYIATGNNTATGTVPGVHRTIAVDPSKIPLGSRVMIQVPSLPQYSGIYVAEDTGGAVNGNIIDIFVGSQNEALMFGRRAILFSVLG